MSTIHWPSVIGSVICLTIVAVIAYAFWWADTHQPHCPKCRSRYLHFLADGVSVRCRFCGHLFTLPSDQP